MKKLILICSIFLFGNSLTSLAQTLNAGDIAIIGVNEDSGPVLGEDHSFTWIALTAIPAGEIIYFTEQGVNINSMTWFANSEGHYRWTSPVGGLPCGTIVHIYENGSSNVLVALGGGSMSSILYGSGWNLSSGDQILAYYASSAPISIAESISSVNFITGMHLNDDQADGEMNGWTSLSYSGTGVAQCHLPPGLINGVNCISLYSGAANSERDNNKYTGTLTGTAATLRGLINSPNLTSGTSPWAGSNTTPQNDISIGTYFPNVTCATACTTPDVPSALSASPSTICPSGNSTISWSGSLNDATAWHIYTSSCGVTQLATTASNSLVVSPSSTTTYYIRGEGGCVTPGTCGQVTVTVSDAINPTISCPGNQVGTVNASCNFSLPDYTGLAVAADNCSGVTATQVPAAGTIVGIGTTNIVLTATDGSSNTSNCNFNVVVSDNTNPTISCPGNQIGSLNGSCNFSLPDYTGLAIAVDNCTGAPTVIQVPAAGTIIGLGTTNIVLTATDGSSNTANCNFDVVVSDNTNPTISCPGNQIGSVNGSCSFSIPDYTGLATPADNCSGVIVTQVPAPGTTVGTGTTNVVLTATDGSSNTANCNFDVVVSDNTNPTISCPGNQIGSVNGSCSFSIPDYTGLATPADNCSSVTVTQVPAPGTIVGTGTTNVVLTATDGSSNTANCNFDVVISDNTNPTITCLGNMNVVADASCNLSLPDYTGAATAFDNCDLSPTVTQSPVAGTTISGAGTVQTVTLTVTDASGNFSQCTFNVAVIDNINPTITCPGNQVQNANASCQASLADYTGAATASDNCTGSPTVTQSPAAGTVITGTTTITMTATDGSSNTAQCTFDVVLNDATAPAAVCQNVNAYLDGSGNATVTAASLDGGSTDNCSGLTFSASQTAFTCADLGPNNVTLTVTDGNSNSSNCVAVVTVIDTISPVVNCLGNQTEVATVACQFTLPDYTVAATVFATDNCGALPTITQSPVAGTAIGLGITTVTLTADDGNGNTTSCNFTVTVSSSATGTLDSTICNGASFMFNGTTYDGTNTAGVETLTGAAANGCDSVVTVTELTAIDVTTTTNNDTITVNATSATYQWLDCNNSNDSIIGETNQSFITTTDGDYAVMVTVGNCTDTSDCVNITTIGINENNFGANISLYPNPTSGDVVISFGQALNGGTIVIVDMTGKQVYRLESFNKQLLNLDINHFSKGVYFVKIQNNNQQKVLRLIKQ